ncbi:DNA-3-methyladenine glycosylase II [Arboricoccus pini]|uniref:DNA-3-methyladenine glycosylase II n=1 Tax=Arboricoccus pini TaxID=1963835 RepID=A0A212R662_9PROT|nr:DNA-3-methyladenine glycosylase [Arboricoccus pini]SNB67661.1 DNA-3-methyladenine glycosylase II [Arboricoccus pini]
MSPPHALDESGLRRALDHLATQDQDVQLALARLGYPAPRIRPEGFATLLQAIVAQQLSTRAAAAIWARVEAACGPDGVRPEAILAMDEPALRACGFSGRKIEYAHGLAESILTGTLDTGALARADDETAIQAIAALRGFGRWSAEIYLLFALGRPDVFPADDLALQIGFQRLKCLEARPTTKALRLLIEPWAPWRGAGAILLWRVYGSATLDGTATPAAG